MEFPSVGKFRVYGGGITKGALESCSNGGHQPRVVLVPNAARLVQLFERRGASVADLPKLYAQAALLLRDVEDSKRAETSKRIRAAIARAEAGSRTSYPSGNRGLAQLALEAVANAVLCWQTEFHGVPLRDCSGTIHCPPAGPGKRAYLFGKDASNGLGAPDPLYLLLSCGCMVEAPPWFHKSRELPLPLNERGVRACRQVAGLALREYLWEMVGWNRRPENYGEPVGGIGIRQRLALHHDENARAAEERSKTQPPGSTVEELHKSAVPEFDRVEGLEIDRIFGAQFECPGE